jgi:hypothetical protein
LIRKFGNRSNAARETAARAWLHHPRHLASLLPDDSNNYYRARELVPADMLGDIAKAKFVTGELPVTESVALPPEEGGMQ